jgi:hypothetical protein
MNTFQLGTFSAGGSQPFAGLVLEDRVIAVRALEGLCSRLGHELKSTNTMLELLEDWSRNLLALEAAVNAIRNDSSLDLPFIPISSLQTLPPVNLPRQIFCSGANYKKHVIDIIVAQGGPHLEGMSIEEHRAWGLHQTPLEHHRTIRDAGTSARGQAARLGTRVGRDHWQTGTARQTGTRARAHRRVHGHQ